MYFTIPNISIMDAAIAALTLLVLGREYFAITMSIILLMMVRDPRGKKYKGQVVQHTFDVTAWTNIFISLFNVDVITDLWLNRNAFLGNGGW